MLMVTSIILNVAIETSNKSQFNTSCGHSADLKNQGFAVGFTFAAPRFLAIMMKKLYQHIISMSNINAYLYLFEHKLTNNESQTLSNRNLNMLQRYNWCF